MTVTINLLGFVLLNVFIAYKAKKQIVHVIPVSMTILMCILLMLGILRRLHWIDVIWWGEIGVLGIISIVKRKRIDFECVKRMLLDPSFIVLIITSILVFLCVKDRLVVSYDELGCWGLEVKTLYYADGFSLAGMHTSIGYSDYLPGPMLFLWWFTHFQTGFLHEGLMYTGYYLFYIFVISLYLPSFISGLKTKKYLLKIVWGVITNVVLLYLPSCVSFMEYKMLSIELLQAALVAVMIFTLYQNATQKITKTYDVITWCALSVLLICLKDSSIVFLAVVYIFGITMTIIGRKRYISIQSVLGGVIGGFAYYIIWKKFSASNGRGALGFRSKVIFEGFHELIYYPEKLMSEIKAYGSSMIKSIMEYPLHLSRGIEINISFTGLIVIVLLCFILVSKLKLFPLKRKERIATVFFFEGIALLSLVVLLFMHVVFFREGQYLDPKTMMYSISRYCEPIFLGILLFFSLSFFAFASNKITIFLTVCILLTADLSVASNGLWNYRADVEGILQSRISTVSNNSKLFNAFDNVKQLQGRYLIICDQTSGVIGAEQDIRFLAAPRSISYYYIDSNGDTEPYRDQVKQWFEHNDYDYYYIVKCTPCQGQNEF